MADQKLLMQALTLESQGEDDALALLARDLLQLADAEDSEHFDDFRSTAMESLSFAEPGGLLSNVGAKPTKTYRDIRERQVAAVLIAPMRYIDVLAPYYVLQLQAFLWTFKQSDGGRPVDIIIDEFTNLPLMTLVSDLTTIRGFGVRCTMIAQATSEIERKFGDKSARTVEEVTDIKQIFGVNSDAEGERLARFLANTDIGAPSYSFPGSGQSGISWGSAARPLMTAQDLRSMSPSEQIVLCKGLRPIRCRKLHYNQLAPLCDLVGDNPVEGPPLRRAPLAELRNNPLTIKYHQSPRPAKAHAESVKPPFPIWRCFLWVPLSVVLACVFWLAPQPHLRWEYRYRGSVNSPVFVSCSYIGTSGTYVVQPSNGNCEIVRWVWPRAS